MFRWRNPEASRLAALNAPLRSAAVAGKCFAILALASALVVVIGGNSHVFGRPLIALLLTALVAAVLVSLRPRLFLAPLEAIEKLDEPNSRPTISADPLFVMSPAPSLLVDCETRDILAANEAAADLYGYSLDDLNQLPLIRLLSTTATPSQAEVGVPAPGLARHWRADGSVFWADLQWRRVEHQNRVAWMVVVTDVSARMVLASELEHSERFALDLLELSLGIIFIHDLNGVLQNVNPAFASAIGYAKDELPGRNLTEFLLSRQSDVFSDYRSSIDRDEGGTGLIHLRRHDGGELVWAFRNRLRTGADGSKSILCCAVDVSENARNERRLLETSRKDPLTGCYGRRHLQIFEEDADPAACWAAIIIDIDHQKPCSDTHGQRLIDQAIVSTARLLKGMVRSDDSVVHLGGCEFVILLRRCDQATLESFAVRLQHARDNRHGVPFTFGMAMRKDAEDLEDTIHRADRQLIERRVIECSGIRFDSVGTTRSHHVCATPHRTRQQGVPVSTRSPVDSPVRDRR